jgi:hypothetical protein
LCDKSRFFVNANSDNVFDKKVVVELAKVISIDKQIVGLVLVDKLG